MKILVTGAGGQIATAISHCFPSHWEVNLLSHEQLDVGHREAVAHAITQFFPDVIVNTAAFTAVDEAEKNPDAAFRVNYAAVLNLASLCAVNAIPLIHLSTDYIFDGDKTAPYQENDFANPLNVYGLSKWKGEEAIRNGCEKYIILRISSIYSPYKHNFVKTLLRLAKERKTLTIVDDQVHCPTSADSVARTLQKMILGLSDKAWGTYHYCDLPQITWYDFGKKIIELGNRYQLLKTQEIQPISSKEFGALALRPRYSVLHCDKIKHFFALTQSNWTDDLEEVVEKILSQKS